MNIPDITIGIMTHNYGKFIKQAVDSVVGQSFTNWELIISDDASQDDTQKIVSGYLSDPRIKYVKHPINLGQAKNWTFLLNSGAAPFLAVLHADDYWQPTILEDAKQQFQNPDTDIIAYNWLKKSKGHEDELGPNRVNRYTTGIEELKYQLAYNTFLPSAVFLRRTLIQMVEPPNPTLKLAVDSEYFIRLCLKARYVKVVNEPLLTYRVHENSLSIWGFNSRYEYNEREHYADIVISHLSKQPHSNRLITKFKKGMAKGFISSAIFEVEMGNSELSFEFLGRGFKYDKWSILNLRFALITIFVATGKSGRNLLQILRKSKNKFVGLSKLLKA